MRRHINNEEVEDDQRQSPEESPASRSSSTSSPGPTLSTQSLPGPTLSTQSLPSPTEDSYLSPNREFETYFDNERIHIPEAENVSNNYNFVYKYLTKKYIYMLIIE